MAPELAFKKATRQQVKLKLAITGPSGSGKTWGALELARGLGKRVAVIDTENGSASLYADRFEFDVIEMHAPFTTAKYIDALNAAVADGYDVVVIDSISHEWAAEGGILDRKTQKDLRGGNQFTNWAEPSAEHEKFKSQLMQSPIHVLATMRSKSEYVLETNDKGKQVPRKVGMAPIQRDGMEYEFSVVFDLGLNHEAQVTKDRTSLFDGRHFKLSPEIGKEIHAWMMKGEKPKAELRIAPPAAPEASGDISPWEALVGGEAAGPAVDDLAALKTEAHKIPFGHLKGRFFCDINDAELKQWMADADKTVKENKKPEWAPANLKRQAIIREEVTRRIALAQAVAEAGATLT